MKLREFLKYLRSDESIIERILAVLQLFVLATEKIKLSLKKIMTDTIIFKTPSAFSFNYLYVVESLDVSDGDKLKGTALLENLKP